MTIMIQNNCDDNDDNDDVNNDSSCDCDDYVAVVDDCVNDYNYDDAYKDLWIIVIIITVGRRNKRIAEKYQRI